MIKVSKFLFGLILLFLSLNYANAVASGVCCYSGGSGITSKFGATSCGDNEVLVSGFENNYDCSFQRKGCMIGSTCYATVLGNQVFDLPEVKNYFSSVKQVSIDSYCSELIPFNANSCTGNYVTQGSATGGNNNAGTGTSSSGTPVQIEDFKINESKINVTAGMKYCSDAGGPFGLFTSKQSCESIGQSSGLSPCLYNPYLSGYVGVVSPDIEELQDMEAACVPKYSIQTCNDYKTQSNCELNPVFGEEKYTKENLKSCRWVPTSSFYGGFSTSSGSGICISDVVSGEKHFNIEGYANRGNLLKNPSFENGQTGWNGAYEIISGVNNAFDGNAYALLNSNSINQDIEFFDVGVSYSFIVYVLGNPSYTGAITAIITEYDSSNSVLQETKYPILLSNFKKEVFQKVVFQSGGHKLEIKTNKINFKIISEENVIIDAVHFGKYNENILTTSSEIFVPFELIHSSASICEVCFNDYNMNFCTKAKSDLLGDCSYMVSGPSESYESTVMEYLGKNENPYLIDGWKSQSIAGSKVFCELYLEESVCTSPDNYINSNFSYLHSQKEGTLCKWDGIYGCFKDSDGSGGPDTIRGGKPFLSVIELNERGWKSDHLVEYEKVSQSSSSLSDFAYSCDVIPPVSYIYFDAKDLTASDITVISDKAELIGDVKIHLEAYDLQMESCSNFDIPSKLYVDYKINGKAHYRQSDVSAIEDYYNVKSYFEDGTGASLLQEGQNSIEISIKDQSGNIAEKKTFNLNLDLSGPNVTLSDSFLAPNVLGPNSNLNFKITDKASIKDCSFTLTPYFDVENSWFVYEGGFFNYTTQPFNADGGEFTFELPIFNTSSKGDPYKLVVKCTDIFNQESVNTYHLVVDFDTDLLLLKPLGFRAYDLDFGFMNQKSDLWAVSTDNKLSSCSFNFGSDGTGSAQINKIDEGFNINTHNDILFFSNITGEIDFGSDGIKEISLTCSDSNSNEYIENLIYYYDTIKPSLVSYSLEGNSISSIKSVVKVNGKYYTRQHAENNYVLDAILNLTLDGTGTWMSDKINLNFKSQENDNLLKRITSEPMVSLVEDSFVANVQFSSFSTFQHIGEETTQENLYLQKYYLNFTDKAGNTNTEQIEFYFDKSKPSFVFGSEVSGGTNGKIFTKTSNPNFEITFNAPEYRTFSCSVNLLWGFTNYKKSFDPTNSLRFKLSDFSETFALDDKKNRATFDIICTDIYGLQISSNYELIYDNTSPELNDVNLDDYSQGIYLHNKEGVEIDQVITDRLVFDFLNTNEVKYNCEYKFTSSDYNCNDEIQNQEFIVTNNKFSYKTPNINLLSNSALKSICYKKSDFNSLLKQYRENNNEILKTKITLNAKCYDAVKLETKSIQKDIPINYISGTQFADFDFEYSTGKVIFIVKSLAPFTTVSIAKDFEGLDEVISLGTHVEFSGGVYVYRGTLPMSETLEEGYYTYWALGKDGEGNIWDRINGQMVVDRSKPELNVFFPDLSDDGNIYSSEFEINFNAKDNPLEFGELDSVTIEVNGKFAYSSKTLLEIDETLFNKLDLSRNYFTSSNLNYFGNAIFNAGEIGKDYKFVITATDKYGNSAQVIKNISVKDGVSIRLLDSQNSVVDFNGFSLITKENAPQFKFRTSKTVEKCSIYPFTDVFWEEITQNPDIANEALLLNKGDAPNNEYTFDLKNSQGFDLSKTTDKSTYIKVVCIYNNTAYNYTRKLDKIDSLPDYVLTSSNGFVLNDEPYETIIDVKSVGAYKYVTCSYGIESSPMIEFENKNDITFNKLISFSDKTDGTYNLILSCKDKFGTKGVDKKYEFQINKGLGINIKNVSIINSNQRAYLSNNNNEFFVDKTSGLGLKFLANKRNLACTYEYSKAGGVFFKIIQFFTNLFKENSINLNTNENPFEFFDPNGITIEDTGKYDLEIICKDSSGNSFDEQYTIQYKQSNENLDFDLILKN